MESRAQLENRFSNDLLMNERGRRGRERETGGDTGGGRRMERERRYCW